MGRSLQFFCLDLSELHLMLESGRPGLAEEVIADQQSEHFAPDDLDQQESSIIWAEILHSLLGGRLGRSWAQRPAFSDVAAAPVENISEVKALALSCIIEAGGRHVGGLSHTMQDGDFFRSTLPAHMRDNAVLNEFDANLLLDRPLFGVSHDSFPSWGGIMKAEIKNIQTDFRLNDRWRSDDGDINSWAVQMLECLDEAHYLGLDVITIYQ